MRRSLLFLFLFCLLHYVPCTAVFGQQRKSITVKFEQASFADLVKAIEDQSTYHFYFDPAQVDSLRVTIDVAGTTLKQTLDRVFAGSGFRYIIDGSENVIITLDHEISAQWKTTALHDDAVLSDRIEYTTIEDDESLFKTTKIFDVGNLNSIEKSQRVSLSGYVKTSNGIPVVGTSIAVHGTDKGTITDNRGFFTLSLLPGSYKLRLTNIGMKATERNVRLHSSGMLNVTMSVEVTNLKELVVTAQALSNVRGLQMGTDRLDVQTLKYIPSTFGETDVLKAVLTLPGVKTVGEASSGFNIRGGSTDQNLILLNESTIFNPFHFFGFFSSFNAESVQDVELHKSIIPARYGGRLASVLKVTGQKGDKEKLKGSAGIGLLTSRINLEGPIIKGKTSFLAGFRTTYSDWIFSLLPSNSGYRETKASFYDLNLTIDHKFNSANSLTFYGYISKDRSNLNTDTAYNYSNRNFSLQWSHDFNEKSSIAVTAGHDHYDYGNYSTADPSTAYALKFSIDQATFKAHFNYESVDEHKLQAGINGVYYSLSPGSINPNSNESLISGQIIPKEQALETAVYVEDQFDISSKLSVQGGIRYSFFNYLGPREVKYYAPGVPRTDENRISSKSFGSVKTIETYHGPEWRLSARYLLNNNLSVKAGYGTARQYIHMLSNTIAIAPTDIWKLSDPNIKPQFSKQLSIGLYMTRPARWEASVEGYFKEIDNYLDYKSGAVLVLNPTVETEVLTTQGRGYGLEFMLKKTFGKLNGWLSYTYSRIKLKVDDPNAGESINNGNYYAASYDKPHDFNFTGNHKFSRRVSFSMNVNYSTGRPVTIPIGVFTYGNSQKTLYSGRNTYRIPDYFRMDFSINIEGNHKIHQLTHSSWTFGIYNLTARKNPYSIYFTSDNGVIKGYKLSIFGSMIPFINYNIRF